MAVETLVGDDDLFEDEDEWPFEPPTRLGHLIAADERDEDLFAVLGSEREEYAPEELAMHLIAP